MKRKIQDPTCDEKLGLTAAEIARYLGVSTSAITKAIARV
jgi:DNA-binding MarR family transcriptional regulator